MEETMKKTGITIKNNAESTDIHIIGEIGSDYSVDDLKKDLKNCKKTINMYISSGGGNVFSGWAMMSALERTKAHITVHIDGIAASMATGIAMIGDVVKMSDNGLFMIHNASSFAFGDKHEIKKTVDLLGKIDTVLANNYTRKTGKTDKQIAKLMDAETWFTAQEALDAGFIDELVEMVDAKNCSENCTLIVDNEFKYKNIPEEKITEIKNTLDLDQDSKQIQNTLTNKEIENMLIDLKSKSEQYNSQILK
jgi:ATP-dependent protease ClpP protease subunit